MKHLLALPVVLLAAACAADRPAPLTNAVPGQPRAAPPSPGAADTPGATRAPRQAAAAGPARFDGTYKGVKTVLVSGGPDCAGRAAPRSLVVQDGQARVVWNPGLGSAFVGSVAPDGALAMTLDQPPAPTALTGSISGAQATGRASLDACEYEMSWRRSR
jgi:hypothetical protein